MTPKYIPLNERLVNSDRYVWTTLAPRGSQPFYLSAEGLFSPLTVKHPTPTITSLTGRSKHESANVKLFSTITHRKDSQAVSSKSLVPAESGDKETWLSCLCDDSVL